MKYYKLKGFLNQFHIWRFHWQLWDCLNDKPSFHYRYQPPGYWTSIKDPKAQKLLMEDPELSKSIDEDGTLHEGGKLR